jgi:ComF family protein
VLSPVRALFVALPAAALDALAVLFPVDCAGCGASDRALCPACRAQLAPHHERRLLGDGTAVFSGLRYEGVVRRTILSLKEQGRTDVAGALAVPLAGTVAAAFSAASSTAAGLDRPLQGIELCTVPPSRAAFRRRGYDPVAFLLRRAGLPVARGVLVSVRQHAQQKVLDRGARQLNLLGSLAARHPLGGRKFVLVDDVVTTGATLVEAARAIRAGGGEVLFAVALANTIRLADDFGSSRHKLVTSPEDGATVSERGAGFISWFHWGVTRHGN